MATNPLLDYATQVTESIQRADQEAMQARMAFALEDFPNYFAGKVDAIAKRMAAQYADLKQRSGDGDGSGSSDGKAG